MLKDHKRYKIKLFETIIKDKNMQMQELEKIKKSGKLRIGINVQEGIQGAPWAWNDEQTKIILGFEADISRALAGKLDIKAEFVPLDTYRLIIGLINNTCDISISAIKSQNKMKGIIYSDPYYYLTQRIVTQEGSNIYDLIDLKGYKVGVLEKSLGEFIIEEENKNLPTPIKILTYNDVLHLFTALQFKEIEAVFIDSPVALWYSKTHINNKLKISDVSYRSGSYSIALREESTELKDAINKELKKINIHEIFEKYGLWDEAQENY